MFFVFCAIFIFHISNFAKNIGIIYMYIYMGDKLKFTSLYKSRVKKKKHKYLPHTFCSFTLHVNLPIHWCPLITVGGVYIGRVYRYTNYVSVAETQANPRLAGTTRKYGSFQLVDRGLYFVLLTPKIIAAFSYCFSTTIFY